LSKNALIATIDHRQRQILVERLLAAMERLTARAEPQITVEPRSYRVSIDTSLGALEMSADARIARRAVNNFLYLAREGFYDGLEVFRLVPHYIAQMGSPTNDAGGEAGFTFTGEVPRSHHYRLGDVALASSGPANGNSSQFFFCLADGIELGPDYPLLGRITSGHEVLSKLNAIRMLPGERPATQVVVRRVAVED
jgi:cyclophilin family peptidyl-prolyl cis-trans isomerase